MTEETQAEDATTEDTTAEDPAGEANNAALQEALEAYRTARESKRVDDLTEELNGYVEAGTMTQEQADLILNHVKEQLAAKNGECPNCGYQFQNRGAQKGGQKGQFGGRKKGQMNGQMPGNQQQMPGNGQMNGRMPGNQQPDAQSGATPNGPMNGQQQAPQR